MRKKYLFITQSDLSPQDSNGRTLRDVFGYVENGDIYSFCLQRYNPSLPASQTFCIDQSRLFKTKRIHREADSDCLAQRNGKSKKLKNPLTCLLRNFAWNVSFVLWRQKLKNWIRQVNPDVIVFNPGDFAFMHKIAVFAAKTAKKEIVIYNTEDYYFKTWNYLHDERGFKFLYPLFRRQLVRAYNRSFAVSKIVMHNTAGLAACYSKAFKDTKHIVVYHPSCIDISRTDRSKFDKVFYYCGALDKGRDKTLILFADILGKTMPDFLIRVNGAATDEALKEFQRRPNIRYEGVIGYDEVHKNLQMNRILLSINSLDEYQLKDKRHAFSTKLSDYIASLNIIFHISLPNDEYDVLKANDLCFVSSNECEISDNLQKLSQCFASQSNPFANNMLNFYQRYLKPENTYKIVREEIE